LGDFKSKNIMNDEIIKDAETEVKTEEESDIKEMPQKQNWRDWYVELALILILGILIGIAVKTEASKRITMGFDDYKIKSSAEAYSISQLEADLKKKFEAEQASQPALEENGEAPGGAEQEAADGNQ
jgi:hypothetical protein